MCPCVPTGLCSACSALRHIPSTLLRTPSTGSFTSNSLCWEGHLLFPLPPLAPSLLGTPPKEHTLFSLEGPRQPRGVSDILPMTRRICQRIDDKGCPQGEWLILYRNLYNCGVLARDPNCPVWQGASVSEWPVVALAPCGLKSFQVTRWLEGRAGSHGDTEVQAGSSCSLSSMGYSLREKSCGETDWQKTAAKIQDVENLSHRL